MSDSNKADMIAAIKKRLAESKAGGGDSKAAKPAGGEGGGDAAADAAPEEDVKARIAALKAKMDAGKGKPDAAKPAKARVKPDKSKNVYPVEPINRRTFGDDFLYKPNTLNLWFIAGSLVLTVACLLMWKRDFDRDWKQWQEVFRLREIERMSAEVEAAKLAIDPAEEEALKVDLDTVVARLEGSADELEDLQEEAERLEGVYYAANQSFQIAKSEYEAMLWEYEELRLAHGEDQDLMDDTQAALDEQQRLVASLKSAADDANNAHLAQVAEVKAFIAEKTELERRQAELTADLALVELSLSKIDHGIFNDYVRNAPLADMLAATLKVEKIVVDKLHDNYNFMYVDRVDMCITCHVGIDKPAYIDHDPDGSRTNEKGTHGERVLNAHPRLDLFVADDSPHPMGTFGCTACHMGRGQAVEFERTFHTPAADQWETAEQKEERWVEEFGYDPERHYWDWPMVSQDLIYSSCFQCHDEQHRLEGVPEYNESRELVEDLGCYGCHKIQGFEYLEKPGPDLTYVSDKLGDDEWMGKWLMSPTSFRPTTRMPHFWNQSNTGAPAETTIDPDRTWNNNSDNYVADWRARNEVEARAVMAYVMDASERAKQEEPWSPRETPSTEGDADNGRDLMESRGCLGCHSLETEGWGANDHGPELSGIGSKVDAAWLYNWILDPKAYYPTTSMPDLRLTEDEAWDITAFLMTQRNTEFEAQDAPQSDQAIVDAIAKEALSSVAGDTWAAERVAAMRAEGGDEAVELFVGEQMFLRYGCSGCHLVPGHYDDVGIGVELTKESLKELTKFDFGHEAGHGNPEAIAHTRRAWYERKITDPRIFDRLPVVADGEIKHYDQKVKLPADKLKMPNFYLDEREVDLVVQFLSGLRADGIDESLMVNLDADEAMVERGSQLITQYNCTGCHRMGQFPTTVTLDGETFDEKLDALAEVVDDEALEYGLWMAEPVNVGPDTLFSAHEWLSDEFFFPEWEEDADIYEYFEEFEGEREIPDKLVVYGKGEGGMGLYIDEKAYRPPTLRDEGAKVNPDWLFEFLMDPYIIRPHLEVRMPTFGLSPDESLAIVRWFADANDQPWPFEVDRSLALDEDLLDAGHELFSATFQCNQCHPAGDTLPSNPDSANWGPDLSMAEARLKLDWIRDWIYDPQAISPGTKMPTFLGEVSDDEYSAYYDDWEDKLDSLVHYMQYMREHDAGQ